RVLHSFPTRRSSDLHIVDLTYQDLVKFYKHHYHPSNAIFATYGNIPAHEHHEKFEELALKRFDKLDIELPVRDEKRMFAPMRVEQRSEEHTSELQSRENLVCRLLLEKKK